MEDNSTSPPQVVHLSSEAYEMFYRCDDPYCDNWVWETLGSDVPEYLAERLQIDMALFREYEKAYSTQCVPVAYGMIAVGEYMVLSIPAPRDILFCLVWMYRQEYLTYSEFYFLYALLAASPDWGELGPPRWRVTRNL